MIDALLTAYGLRTGRFTSPHLETLRERIRLDGELIDAGRLLAAWEDLAPLHRDGRGRRWAAADVLRGAHAAGVRRLRRRPGLGGRHRGRPGGSWDSTNVIDPSGRRVLMPIGLDHMDWLGRRPRRRSRGEKAGIIEAGHGGRCLAEQEPAAAEVLLERAAEVGADVLREGVDFGVVDRQVAVGGQLLTLRGSAVRTTTSSFRCTASTRRSNAAMRAGGRRGLSRWRHRCPRR